MLSTPWGQSFLSIFSQTSNHTPEVVPDTPSLPVGGINDCHSPKLNPILKFSPVLEAWHILGGTYALRMALTPWEVGRAF